jgi:subfamily B ATP-binding cassette protein MsbA
MTMTRQDKLKISGLLRPYWKSLAIAFVALIAEAGAGLLEPWPLKVVIDNLLQSKALPEPIGSLVASLFGSGSTAVLTFAVAAVAIIAVVGAISAYVETYLTTSVSQWIGHDLRRTLYHHIQRLSLADHDKARTGDLITRVTSDISTIQSFIDSALLGILMNVITLAGMIGVMFYLDWRFTLVRWR